jgi:protease-4
MIPQPPPGHGPIDPRGAFTPHTQGTPSGTLMPPFPQWSPGMFPPPPPPASFFPPPQPPRRGGVGRAILLTLVVLGLFLSLLLNFALVFGGAGESDSAERVTVTSGDADQTIAVVPLRGLIEVNASSRFDRFLDLIEKDADVKALVVEIDSPGGTVTASDEIYNRLLRFKANRKIPVVVAMGSMATSGGYYTACGADYIFAQPTTITGNIGVLFPRFNFARLMEKYGVEETTIVATGSTFKNAGSSFAEETPEEKAYWQGLIDQAYGRFKTVVQAGRGQRLAGSMAEIANGKAYTADEALALGLIDQKGYADDAYVYAARQAKLGQPRVTRYEQPAGFLDRILSSKSNAGGAGASAGGVNVTVDATLLEQLSTPRLLYLWSAR